LLVYSIAKRLKKVKTINLVCQKQHQDPKISSDAILPVTVYFYDKEIGPVQVANAMQTNCLKLTNSISFHIF